jgi:hypothetical protein
MRAAGLQMRNRAAMAAMAKVGANARAIDESVEDDACPVGQVLKKTYDDDGDVKYYKSPDEVCGEPDDALESQWTKESPYPRPASWVDESEAVVFACAPRFVQRSNPKGKTYCLDTDLMCPIGAPLKREKKDSQTIFIDPDTEDACLVPALATPRLLAGKEQIVELQCPYNTYAAQIKDAGAELLECISCPMGYVTKSPGSQDPKTCVRKCPEGSSADPMNPDVCLPCAYNATFDDSMNACRCNLGYFGNGMGDEGCELCTVGSYCDTGIFNQEVDLAKNEYVAFKGAVEPKICPEGTKSVGVSCDCNDPKKQFFPDTGTCEPIWCDAGTLLDGRKCVPCKAGYSCAAGDATRVPTICPKGSYCPEGSKTPVNCGNRYCPREGMVAPEACPAGAICKDGMIGGCQPGLNFNVAAGQCQTCRVGYSCPQGIEIGCPVQSYQDQTGQTACKACPAGQVGEKAYAATKCIVGKFEPMSNPRSSITLQPGAYKFRLAGGGGGSGSTTCSNCGWPGNSGAGGNGELVESDIVVLDRATTVNITIGLGGNGGDMGSNMSAGRDANAVNGVNVNLGDVFNVAGCTYSCSWNGSGQSNCHDGVAGGQTRVAVNGREFVARGGGGGWSKLRVKYEAGGYANYRPSHAGNGEGGRGGKGVIQEGVAGHVYYSDGFGGEPGWVQVLQMVIPN